jgi:hypothetical protein
MIGRLARDQPDEAASEVVQKNVRAPSDGVDVAFDPGPRPTISTKSVLVQLSDHRRQLVRTSHSHLVRSTFNQGPSANI